VVGKKKKEREREKKNIRFKGSEVKVVIRNVSKSNVKVCAR